MKTIRFLPEDPRQKLFWRKAIDVEVAPFAAPSPSGYRTLLVEGLLSLFFFALLYAIFWLCSSPSGQQSEAKWTPQNRLPWAIPKPFAIRLRPFGRDHAFHNMNALSVLFVLCASFALCVATPRSKFSPAPTFPPQETRFPPCCGDTLGSTACKRLRTDNPVYFQRRCDAEPDFSLIQCCASCGVDSAAQRHRVFFAEGTKSNHCFDRHGGAFCERFVMKKGVWSKGSWSCSGENAQLSFRLCRKSCGYCKRDLYAGRDGGEFRPTPCGQVPDYVFPTEN